MPERVVWEGRPARLWAAEWGLPRFEVWDSIGSTNDRARELAEQGSEPFTAVLAREQTRGRGRGGKAWASARGRGLWFSVVTRPAAAATPLAPILAGLAVVESLRTVSGVEARLKWPNDVLVGHRKLAGILCEGAGDAVVIGIGVNLEAPQGGFSGDLARTATTLAEHQSAPTDPPELVGVVLDTLRALPWHGPVLDPAVLPAWHDVDALDGHPVICSIGVRGTARGISADGALRVETEDGIEHVRGGSVRRVDSPSEVAPLGRTPST